MWRSLSVMGTRYLLLRPWGSKASPPPPGLSGHGFVGVLSIGAGKLPGSGGGRSGPGEGNNPPRGCMADLAAVFRFSEFAIFGAFDLFFAMQILRKFNPSPWYHCIEKRHEKEVSEFSQSSDAKSAPTIQNC